jgi:hypothetical protein
VITAVDTNVLLDLFVATAQHHAQAERSLEAAYNAGAIVVCDVVYAELVPGFVDRDALDAALREMNAELSPLDTSIAWEAGVRWMRYRRAGGPRTRILADFLIGAHALATADVFLTRDRGFYDTYFPDLTQAPLAPDPPGAG